MSFLKSELNKYPLHVIQEAGFSRMMQHIKGLTNNRTFGIISAERPLTEFTVKENAARTANLKSDIRSNGLGFTIQEGHWGDNKEISLFVVDISEELIMQLMAKYEQDAVVFGHRVDGGLLIDVIYSNGDKDIQDFLLTDENSIAQFITKKMAYGYSKKKGRQYVIGKKDELYPDIKEAYFESACNSSSANAVASNINKVLLKYAN